MQLFCVLMPMLLAGSPPSAKTVPSEPPATTQPDSLGSMPRPQVPTGLLTPITEEGGLPRIYSKLYDLTAEERRHRAAVRDYAKQIRLIRTKHFGQIKVKKIRDEGIAQLSEFTDAAAFGAMIRELERETDEIRLAMLDHFAKQGQEGQAALAWVAIYDFNAAMQNEATRRMTEPVSEPVRYLLDRALRSKKHEVANSAASLAGSLNVLEAIPLLIFAQAVGERTDADVGDLAWIAIQTQTAFVSGLTPVVGDNTGAFQPIISTLSEGVVMRVVDAVVISYRTTVHDSLVNMTSGDWGQPTEPMGYNIKAWWDWYNTQYVPFKNEQAKQAELVGEKTSE